MAYLCELTWRRPLRSRLQRGTRSGLQGAPSDLISSSRAPQSNHKSGWWMDHQDLADDHQRRDSELIRALMWPAAVGQPVGYVVSCDSGESGLRKTAGLVRISSGGGASKNN